MSHTKTDESIEMQFGLRTRVGPGNHVLEGVQIPPWKGAILSGGDWGKEASHCKVYGHSADPDIPMGRGNFGGKGRAPIYSIGTFCHEQCKNG